MFMNVNFLYTHPIPENVQLKAQQRTARNNIQSHIPLHFDAACASSAKELPVKLVFKVVLVSSPNQDQSHFDQLTNSEVTFCSPYNCLLSISTTFSGGH